MRRALIRVVMGVVGVCSFLVYAGGAYLVYLLVRHVWADRPSALTVVAVIAGVTLLLGYASYRTGTRGLLAAIETFEPRGWRAAELQRRLRRLSDRMDLEEPRLLFTDLGEPNAFAMGGPDGGVVFFDRRLFALLDDDQLEGILAHELAHLESHDGLVQLVAFTGLQTVVTIVSLVLLPLLLLLAGMARGTAWVRGAPSRWSRSLAWRLRTLVLGIVMVGPAVFTFVLLVRSRRREFAADARAAEVTGDPEALASALETVDAVMTHQLRLQGLLPADGSSPASDPLYRLLATHPAMEARVARLRARADDVKPG